MALLSDARATQFTNSDHRAEKKVTRPGRRPGGSGTARGWMRRPCRTQDPQSERFRAKRMPVRVKKTRQTKNQLSRSSNRSVVIAGANGADVVAVSIELANEGAAAIAAITIKRAIVR